MLRFKGLVAATFTPMHEDGSIAPEKVPMLVEHSLKNGMAGLFAIGSTGEFPSLTHEERRSMAEAFIGAAAGRIPVIINVGSCSVRESQALAEHAAEAGADAVCAMVPFYFRPPTVRELADCLKEIAKACARKPLYLYHVPCMTHANLPIRDLLPIMAQECPEFAGIKYTDENLCEFQRCVDYSDHFPRLYRELLKAYEAGDIERARSFQELTHRGIVLIGRYGMSSQKLYMKFAGLDVGPMRLPAPRLPLERELAFRRDIAEAGLDPWLG